MDLVDERFTDERSRGQSDLRHNLPKLSCALTDVSCQRDDVDSDYSAMAMLRS